MVGEAPGFCVVIENVKRQKKIDLDVYMCSKNDVFTISVVRPINNPYVRLTEVLALCIRAQTCRPCS